jgi:acetylornithine deacetylase/succinyl-diaminopimelate desuccinylase-like protein
LSGLETHVLVSAPNRANFVARLRAGAPSKRPVLIMGHMDVVGADTAKWDTVKLNETTQLYFARLATIGDGRRNICTQCCLA